MEVLKAQIEDLKAKAMANEGLGVERASRIQENRALAVERIAEAQKDKDLGTLDRIKAVKELTSLDLEQLVKSIELIKSIQEGQDIESQERTKEALGEAPQPQGAVQ